MNVRMTYLAYSLKDVITYYICGLKNTLSLELIFSQAKSCFAVLGTSVKNGDFAIETWATVRTSRIIFQN
jgi:hypothetical protein